MIEESWDDHDDVQQQNLNKAFEQHNIAPVLGIGRSKPAAAPVVTSMNKIDAPPAPSRWNGGGTTTTNNSNRFANQNDFPRTGNDRTCYSCHETGHTSRDCPEPKNRFGGKSSSFNQTDSNNKPAFQSFRNGGSSDTNNNNNGSFRPKDSFNSANRDRPSAPGGNNCFNCQKPGHISRDCPEPKKSRDGPSSGTGFFSSGRRNDKVTDDIFDQPGAGRFGPAQPVERYIPPAPPTTEEDIFGEALAKGENFDRYHRAQVKCTPEGRVRPIELYEEANLPTQILSNIRRAHFEEPTPIQRYTIPSIRQQDDIMACAQTGSGKTAAFLLPILSNLLEYHADELEERAHPPSPLCLVLSPTRELALQTEREARKFAFQTPIVPCSAVGGHDMFAVSDRLREGCHLLSATTGRLKDMVDKGRISLRKVKYFVLDEADRMLDTGFEPDIRKLETLGLPPRSERYTSMFSATFPEQVQKLAKHFLRDNYIFLAVGTLGGANEDIAQTIELVPQANKKDRLFQLLEANLKSERCLIFVETKRSADYIGALLSQRELMSTTMHGDRTQRQRHEAVQQFTNGKCPILVATSVAARGLDFPLIGYVVNYDLPDTTDFYIHRIGRTGRAGHLGRSISFFDPNRESDRTIAPELVQRLMEAGQEVPDFLKQYVGGAGASAAFSNAKFNDTRSFGGNRPQQGPGGTTSAGAATEDWD